MCCCVVCVRRCGTHRKEVRRARCLAASTTGTASEFFLTRLTTTDSTTIRTFRSCWTTARSRTTTTRALLHSFYEVPRLLENCGKVPETFPSRSFGTLYLSRKSTDVVFPKPSVPNHTVCQQRHLFINHLCRDELKCRAVGISVCKNEVPRRTIKNLYPRQKN